MKQTYQIVMTTNNKAFKCRLFIQTMNNVHTSTRKRHTVPKAKPSKQTKKNVNNK